MRPFVRVVPALALSFLALPAAAQTPQIDDVIVNQNQIIERYREPPDNQGSLGVSVDVDDAYVPEVEGLTVTLERVRLDGADQLSPGELEAAWQPYLGTVIDDADMEAITDAIEAAYRAADYYARAVVTRIDLNTGELTITVYAGFISEIVIESDANVGELHERLHPYTEKIVAMVPLRVSLLERYLLLIADLGGYNVNALFEQIPEGRGAGRLTLSLSRQAVGGQVTLNNHDTRETGPVKVTGVVQGGDQLGLFEQSVLVGVVNPTEIREFRLLNFGQDYPLGTDGLSLGYALTGVKVEPGGAVKALNIEVTTLSGATSLQYPFIRRIDHNLIGRLEFNVQNTDVDVASTPVTVDRTRWISVKAAYDEDFDLLSLATGILGAQGIDGLGATSGNRALAGRLGGEANFRLVSGTLALNAPIAPG